MALGSARTQASWGFKKRTLVEDFIGQLVVCHVLVVVYARYFPRARGVRSSKLLKPTTLPMWIDFSSTRVSPQPTIRFTVILSREILAGSAARWPI